MELKARAHRSHRSLRPTRQRPPTPPAPMARRDAAQTLSLGAPCQSVQDIYATKSFHCCCPAAGLARATEWHRSAPPSGRPEHCCAGHLELCLGPSGGPLGVGPGPGRRPLAGLRRRRDGRLGGQLSRRRRSPVPQRHEHGPDPLHHLRAARGVRADVARTLRHSSQVAAGQGVGGGCGATATPSGGQGECGAEWRNWRACAVLPAVLLAR